MNSYILYYLLPLVGFLISLLAQIYVSYSYKHYKKEEVNSGKSGFEVARKILDKNGLKDIHIVETSGELTDHYDPRRKVIKLSKDIFHGTTIASCSVAAHECGHAIQDKEGYAFMRFRSFLVPFVNLTSKLGYVAIFIGFILGLMDLAFLGIILLTFMLIFELITLPVEFDASRRARVELSEVNILDDDEASGSRKMLFAAACTYVAALITTFLEILRLCLVLFNNRD